MNSRYESPDGLAEDRYYELLDNADTEFYPEDDKDHWSNFIENYERLREKKYKQVVQTIINAHK